MGITSATGAAAAATSPTASGKLHGGANPIQQANITLWETYTYGIDGSATGRTALSSNSGYGSKAYSLATTTTDSNGYWRIGSFNCDPGEFVYVTATGGKTASNAANPNEVMIAPMGACSALPASINTDISELSTLAIAYTLGHFLSEDASHVGDGQQLVYIGAPAANNAAASSCTGTGASMTCVASGLGQAFTDALSLVPSTSYVSSIQTVLSANTVPTDPSGNMPNATGAIPAALLNTLANVLQSCVNTSGGTATGAPASGCGKLFTATTVGSSVPTDTLQAAISIAQNPANNVTGIYPLANPITAFTPALTAQPNDFSLAVSYTGSDATNNKSFAGPVGPVFAPNGTALFGQFSKGVGVYQGLLALSPSLQQLAVNTATSQFFPLAVDNAGNLYISGAQSILRMDATTLIQKAALTVPGGVTADFLAVDRNNTVYATIASVAQPLYEAGPNDTALSAVGITGTPSLTAGTGTAEAQVLAFDASEDLWMGFQSSSNGLIGETLHSGTGCTLPTFCSSTLVNSSSTAMTFLGPILTSDGSAWFNSSTELYQVASNGTVQNTYTAPGAVSTLELGVSDGAGTLFYPALGTTSSVAAFVPSTQTWVNYVPCTLVVANSATQATTCSDLMYAVITTNVDASGAIWLPDYYGNKISKLFGVGAPTWPYAGYNHPGEMPH